MGLFDVTDKSVRCECPVLVQTDVMLHCRSFAFHKFMYYFGLVHEYVFRGMFVSAELNF